MAAEQIQYGLFHYTDDNSHGWTVRCDRDWGTNADSGLSAQVDGEKRFEYFSKRFHPRYAILSDSTTGRKTRRICGTNDCTAYAGVNAGGIAHVGDTRYELQVPVPGLAGTVTYKRVKRWPENLPSDEQPRNFDDHA
jgi:hypothetical protein